MISFKGIKPEFWDAGTTPGPSKGLFNYRRIWRMAIVMLAVVALVPLIVMTVIDYNVTRNSLTSENMFRTARTTSNTRRALAYFFTEHKNALKFIVDSEDVHNLQTPDRLKAVLTSLQKSFGGFVDLGLIDESGRQVAYVGPYELKGRNYADQKWFEKLWNPDVLQVACFWGTGTFRI